MSKENDLDEIEKAKKEIAKEVILEEIKKSTIFETSNEDGDSFFKGVINHLMNIKNNVSTKTEYLSVNENFTGTKLQFLADCGNIPYLKEFMTIFETKRISLERKGRKELLIALKERQQELERERAEKLNSLSGSL